MERDRYDLRVEVPEDAGDVTLPFPINLYIQGSFAFLKEVICRMPFSWCQWLANIETVRHAKREYVAPCTVLTAIPCAEASIWCCSVFSNSSLAHYKASLRFFDRPRALMLQWGAGALVAGAVCFCPRVWACPHYPGRPAPL